jgi:hypothetical protein
MSVVFTVSWTVTDCVPTIFRVTPKLWVPAMVAVRECGPGTTASESLRVK